MKICDGQIIKICMKGKYKGPHNKINTVKREVYIPNYSYIKEELYVLSGSLNKYAYIIDDAVVDGTLKKIQQLSSRGQIGMKYTPIVNYELPDEFKITIKIRIENI